LEAELSNSSCLSNDLVMKGKLLSNEPMAAHTSWRVGGPADSYYMPVNLEDLSVFLSELRDEEKVFWLGLGSNLLVRDGGIRGTIIATKGVLNEMELKASGMKVGAGLTCAKAARFSASKGKRGAEFLAGIPGTIGGALTMNAGAFGSEMWNIVSSVETINRQGEIQVRSAADFEARYRFVNIANDE
jgi:UDP-N-acetylmuramate dehydrogenase